MAPFRHPGRLFIHESHYALPQHLDELKAYIDRYIAYVFQLARTEPVAPVDLNRIYRELGIEVQLGDLGPHARGFVIPALGKVVVNNDDSRERRRYTAAHELMELFFEALLSCILAPEFRALCTDTRLKERLCEEGAARFLMPDEAVDELLAAHSVSFTTADRMARTFEASFSASLRRMVRRSPRNTLLIVAEVGRSLRQQRLFGNGQLALSPDLAGAQPKPRLRIRSTLWSRPVPGWQLWSNTSIPESSLIFRAYESHEPLGGVERLRLGSRFDGQFRLEAWPRRHGEKREVVVLVDVDHLDRPSAQLEVPFQGASALQL